MNIKLDLKSALVGLALGVGAMAVVGAGEPSSASVGRFQIAGSTTGFFLMVDTETGQSWCANVATPGLVGVPGGFFDRKLSR